MNLLPARDSAEFSAGILAGLALGAGLGLLAVADRPTRGRIAGRLGPARRQLRRDARQVRRSGRRTLRDASQFRTALSDLGREFIQAARSELLAEAATSEPLAKLRVCDVLEAMPAYGPVKAERLMEDLGIASSRRVRGLGVRQRSALLETFAERS